MSHQILDGRALAQESKLQFKQEVSQLIEQGIIPKLVVIQVGDDPASTVYVRSKEKAAQSCGILGQVIVLKEHCTETELLTYIDSLNQDPSVDGILVQLPLPAHINSTTVIHRIDPSKDVDGFHPNNMGALVLGDPLFIPCTPYGMMALLEKYHVPIVGQEAVIVGTSNIVGKPMGFLLQQAGATVTFCNTKTRNLKSHTQRADILVVATGVKHLITGDMVKEGVCVLDVGIHRLENKKLTGDVDFNSVAPKARYITPVPGGVGPMTITQLLKNTLMSAKRRGKQ